MPTSPIPPLTDAELAALERGWCHDSPMRRLIAEVRAARESAARHEAEAERRRAMLDGVVDCMEPR
jgi:hypothetical protein